MMTKSPESNTAIPHVSFGATKKVIIALYAFKKSGSAIEIMGLVDLNKTNTSKALSVARSLGFVDKPKRGVYDLTKTGKELARLFGFGKHDDAAALVKEALLTRKEWEEVVAFLRASASNPRNPLDLVHHVESKMDKQWTPSMRNSLASMYKSILIGGGLIKSDETQIVSLLSIDKSDETASSIPSGVSSAFKEGSDLDTDIGTLGYITFSLPNLYSFNVKATRYALSTLREQIMDGTPIAIWIDASLDALEKEEE
jgi:hypothetical protein